MAIKAKDIKKNIFDLGKEYDQAMAKRNEFIGAFDKQIKESEAEAVRLADILNGSLADKTPEEYLKLKKDLDLAKASAELATRQREEVRTKFLRCRGFNSEDERKAFVGNLKSVFEEDEQIFSAEAMEHLRALAKLLSDREVTASEAMRIAQGVDEIGMIRCGVVRQIVGQMARNLENQTKLGNVEKR